MSKNRICPVCENEIPDDARFECHHCWSDLKKISDEDYVTTRRLTYQQENEKRKAQENASRTKEHRKAGILGALIAPIIYLVIGDSGDTGWWVCLLPLGWLLCLPLGLLTGHLGLYIEKKLIKPMNSRFVFLMLTFFLSTILYVVFNLIIEGL